MVVNTKEIVKGEVGKGSKIGGKEARGKTEGKYMPGEQRPALPSTE